MENDLRFFMWYGSFAQVEMQILSINFMTVNGVVYGIKRWDEKKQH